MKRPQNVVVLAVWTSTWNVKRWSFLICVFRTWSWRSLTMLACRTAASSLCALGPPGGKALYRAQHPSGPAFDQQEPFNIFQPFEHVETSMKDHESKKTHFRAQVASGTVAPADWRPWPSGVDLACADREPCWEGWCYLWIVEIWCQNVKSYTMAIQATDRQKKYTDLYRSDLW